jgi:exopolysaccharide biosynthesis polyprenyl glycosylphosphotransferase
MRSTDPTRIPPTISFAAPSAASETTLEPPEPDTHASPQESPVVEGTAEPAAERSDAGGSDAGGSEPAAGSSSRRSERVVSRRGLVPLDLLLLVVGWGVAVVAGDLLGSRTPFAELVATGAVVALAGLGLLWVTGVYERASDVLPSLELARIGRALLGLVVLTVVLRINAGAGVALVTAAVAGATWSLLLYGHRGLRREWLRSRRASGQHTVPAIVVAGDGASARDTAAFLRANPLLGFEVRGIVCPPDDRSLDAEVAWHGDLGVDADAIRRTGATEVIIDSRELTGEQLSRGVQALSADDLHVHVASGLRGVQQRRLTVNPMADEVYLHVAPARLTPRQVRVKRVLDVVLGSVALVLLAPILAVSAAVIWLGDRGPVLFRQERVGRDGGTFTLYKLRTMVVDAESRREELEAANQRSGPLFKLSDDPRVTRFGRLARATSIDEIPQLFNVLQGHMSLVGPRPALPAEVEEFDDDLRRRTQVKPGITGLWQVEARDSENFDLYRRYDLLYVDNWSVSLDLAILARTVASVGLRGLSAIGLLSRDRDSGGMLD